MRQWMLGAACAAMVITAVVHARVAPCDGYALKSGVCVAPSIVEATFAGYQEGQQAPVHQWEETLVGVQAQFAEQNRQRQECIGQLGPLQAKANQEALKQQQAEIQKQRELAAPPGTVWDGGAGRYQAKPAEAPTVGRGGSR